MFSVVLALAISCLDPADRGAIPNDGVSDRAAIQATMDAASGDTVCLGPGRWTVEKAPIGSYNRLAALSTHGQNVVIRGSGPSTIIEMVGDQKAATVAVLSIDPGARNVTISDLTIDTSGAYNTDEQTHAIQIGSSMCAGATCAPVFDVTIERVRFLHPRGQDGSRKGDCVRILGNTEVTAVVGVRILGAAFAGCARSGISIQRNAHQIVVQASSFSGTGDQDIDSEPTGSGTNSDVSIIGNMFIDPLRTSQGDHAVTLGGISAPMDRITVIGNIFDGRGLGMYRTANVIVSSNVFRSTMTGGAGVIGSANVLQHAIISNNVIARHGSPGPLIRATPQSGGVPYDVMISENDMTNHTDGPGVYLESASGVTVSSNAIRWSAPATLQAGIYMRATTAAIDGVAIAGNRLSSPDLGYAVFLSASPFEISGVSLIGNRAKGSRAGMSCAGPVVDVVSVGNSIGPRSCSQAGIGD